MNTNALMETAPVAAASFGLAADTAGTQLAASELERGRLYLRQAQNYVAGAIVGLSDAQWRFKPAPDRWSIAENVDHIITVQEFILGPILEKLALEPASAADRDYKMVDDIVVDRFPNRLSKFPAPEGMRPAGQFTLAVASGRLLTNYKRLVDYLESATDLRGHTLESRPLKAITKGAFEVMDGYQWVLAVAGHTERHAKQILEVKAELDFPAQ
jgi:hypothetical protein